MLNLKKFALSLKKDQKGSILIQVALSSMVLVGLLGMGVDLGRAYLYRAQLSGALDAAALNHFIRLPEMQKYKRSLIVILSQIISAVRLASW